MNQAYLNITVRVASQQAMAQMKQLNNAARQMGAAGGVAASGLAPLDKVFKNNSLERFGKNLQWTGRQIEFNFTLPLLLAGGAAGKWAVQNEAAMTRVRKVYGDVTDDAGMLTAELDALGRSFELLSSRFGVHQDEVIEIGAAWAQAGVAGAGLARSTRNTLEAMILGDMDAAKATEGLIAVQSAFRLSSEQLKTELMKLNAVENTTAISFGGLIDVIQRAGGVAYSAGIDIRHLSAMAATLVPAGGSASQAGNALRTMISRIISPTKDAAQVMKLMGVNVMDASFQAANGMRRIEMLATAFDNLSQSEKINVSALIASRWQINRFDLLMAGVAGRTDVYNKALQATSDEYKDLAGNTAYVASYTRELSTYLASQPQAFKMLTTQIQNALARAIIPMLPAIIALLTRVVQLTNWFANLSPEIQQMALMALLAVAAVGPLARYIGAFAMLGSLAGKAMGFLAIMTSRQAAAATVAAASNAANAGEVHGLALAAAKARLFINGLFVAMWKIVTLPFAAIGGAMGLIWRGFLRGGGLAMKMMGGIWRYLLNLIPATTTVGSALSATWAMIARGMTFVATTAAKVGRAIPLAFAAAGRLAQTALVVIPKAAMIAWRTMPVIAGIVGQGITLAMRGAAVAAQAAWVVFTTGLPALWRTLPALAGIIGQGIVAAYRGAAIAATIAWGTFTTALPAMWRTLPVMAGIVGMAISRVWAATAASTSLMSKAIVGVLGSFRMLGVYAGMLFKALPTIAWLAAKGIGAALLSPWGLVIAAVVGVAIIFRKQIGEAVNWMMDRFNLLPKGIANVFQNIIRIIGAAISTIARFISKIFGGAKEQTQQFGDEHRAPIRRAMGGPVPGTGSADNVLALLTPGEFVINKKAAEALGPEVLKRLNKYAAGGVVQPSPELSAFNRATSEGRASIERAEIAEMRADVLSFSPNAGPAFDALVASLGRLKAQLASVNEEYVRQADVVQNVSTYVDALNVNLDREKTKLDALKDAASKASDELDAAKDVLQQLGDTPITGMRAMEDQIFENEMAQKRLRLEIMRMEDEAGGSVDDLRKKMAALQGDIETLTGERTDLRMAGAGSDILATYDQQIAALEQQRTATQALVKPIEDAENQLEQLQRTGERLDLENSINFDPALRQIDQLLNAMNEMPADEIIAGIRSQQEEVARLTTVWEEAEAAAQAQQDVVNAAEQARDAGQAILDTEQSKLEQIKNTYDEIEQQIRDSESAMRDFAQAAAAAKSATDDMSFGEELFLASGDASFDIPEPGEGLGREGGLAEIEAFNKEMEAELERAMQDMGKFDLFAPFRDMWNKGIDWFKEQTRTGFLTWLPPAYEKGKEWALDLWGGISESIGGAAEGFSLEGVFDKIKTGDFAGLMQPVLDVWNNLGDLLEDTPVGTAFENIGDALGILGGAFEDVFGWIQRNVWPVLKEIGGWFKEAGAVLWGELQKWAPLFDPFIEAVGHIFAVVTWVVKAVAAAFIAFGAVLLGIFAVIWPPLFNLVKPVFDLIVGAIVAAMEIIRGIISVVLGVINGDWSLVWNGILAIIEGVWDAIYAVVSTVFGLIYGVIKGIIESIVNIFTWLYDILIGHSIVPDLVNGILALFQFLWDGVKYIFTAIGAAIKWVWDNVIMPVWDAFKAVWTNVLQPLLNTMLDVFKVIFTAIGNSLKWVWDNIIQPVWDAFGWIWNRILSPAMETMRKGFGVIWDAIGNSLSTMYSTVIQPVWNLLKGIWTDVLKPAMDTLKSGFESIWNGVGEAIKTGVNLGIKAINFLIRGINALSDLIPGIDFTITEIQEFKSGGTLPFRAGQMMAAGGRIGETDARVRSGMVTNMPRAIVGEGNPLYPEYVVPTDPRYRSRALDLWTALGRDLGYVSGHAGTDEQGGWGPLPSPSDVWEGAKDVVGTIRRGAVTAAFAPFLKLFDTAVSPVPEPLRGLLKGLKDNVYNWVKGVDDNTPVGPTAGNEDVNGSGWSAISQWLRSNSSVPFRITSTYRAGDPGFHGKNRAVDFAGPTPSRDSNALLAINNALMPIAGTLKELIYSGPGGHSYKNGTEYAYSAGVRADHHDHVHAALANGGRLTVGRRPGGTLLRVGEGRWDEEVQVKPLRKNDMQDGTTVNFYGDLYFPNVSDGEDAEDFIRNIEDLF